MADSFDRIAQHKTVYVIVAPETGSLEATAALSELELAEVAPAFEQQGLTVTPWTPRKGDLVEFCEDGGGVGQVVKVLKDGNAVQVDFGNGQPETWDSFMLDPIKLA